MNLLLLTGQNLHPAGRTFPREVFADQNDYSFMWWEKTIKTGNQIFAVKTNRYALSFDYATLSVKDFSILKDPAPEALVLRESKLESFPEKTPLGLQFGLRVNGVMSWCERSSGDDNDCQLVETGKYVQRRFITKIPGLVGCDPDKSGLEIVSWPDRIAFILKATPPETIEQLVLHTNIEFPENYEVLLEQGAVSALKDPSDGSGFILLKSAEATQLSIEGTRVQVQLAANGPARAQEELNSGIIVYPVASDIDAKLKLIAEQTSAHDRVLRLQFAKGRFTPNGAGVFGHTGIPAILRDRKGNPMGIPIRISKNWHAAGRPSAENDYFRGSWVHGFSLLTNPADSRVELENTSVNALWGGVPAASHAQLCLMGWGSNQQWDQSAIGAWGESITYEPDLDQTSAPLLDLRPLMVRSSSGDKWRGTGNMGGADFFNLTREDGRRAWHSRMRTQYRSYGPNFTEATYAGELEGLPVEFEYTASLGRSDGMVRGMYRLRLRVLEDVSFKDFVIFQVAAPTYHFVKSRTLAWGNEAGLVQEWEATIQDEDRCVTPGQVAGGRVPWFSFTDSEFTTPREQYLPANRGFVIREWKARINAQDEVRPWFAETSTGSKRQGGPSAQRRFEDPVRQRRNHGEWEDLTQAVHGKDFGKRTATHRQKPGQSPITSIWIRKRTERRPSISGLRDPSRLSRRGETMPPQKKPATAIPICPSSPAPTAAPPHTS